MNPWRHVVILSLLLGVAAGEARAQTVAVLATNATVSLDGFTGTITSLNCASCNSGDQLEVIALGKDIIEFEIVNSQGSTSAILASTGASETLGFTLAISPTAGYTHAIGKATSATQTVTGYAAFTCSGCNGLSTPATGSASFSNTVAPSPLLASLAIQKGVSSANSATQETNSASSTSFAASNSFTVTETLSLNPSSKTAARLEFDALALKLTTTPEPASIVVLMTALAGLATVRRRLGRHGSVL